ncbi:MAG: DNA-processing protein DprA [Candidatus Babeliaceae bacterium]|nr:DNA-processing protein DprA [Candidatus Babeliaceae bacterium]
MSQSTREVILHCSLIDGVGPAVLARLQRFLPQCSFPDLYQWRIADFIERIGFSERLSKLFVDGLRCKAMLDRELHLLERHQISWVVLGEDDYPALLREIYLPPTILYWCGASPHGAERAVAFVGSRQAGDYARRVVETLVPGALSAGAVIVSGGAIGADTMAHEAALCAGGKTVAVLGSGLLRPYPAVNKRLFDRIVASGGTLLSSFSLGTAALPGHFPARNRIISGMCQATVVVQAAEKSGARITALQALEQGRTVCVVPGDIFNPLSVGCHRLLEEGATPVTSATDLLRALGWEVCEDMSSESTAKSASTTDPLVFFCRVPRTFDELLHEVPVPAVEMQDRLFNLQITGAILQDFTGRWVSTQAI